MTNNKVEEQRETSRHISLEAGAGSVIGALCALVIGAGIIIQEKDRFQENEKRYLYEIGGGITICTYLIDTNKDGVAVPSRILPNGREVKLFWRYF